MVFGGVSRVSFRQCYVIYINNDSFISSQFGLLFLKKIFCLIAVHGTSNIMLNKSKGRPCLVLDLSGTTRLHHLIYDVNTMSVSYIGLFYGGVLPYANSVKSIYNEWMSILLNGFSASIEVIM